MCGICDWKNHSFINTDTQTIHYNDNFCKRFIGKWSNKIWVNKYDKLFSVALLLDEFVFLISHERLIEFPVDRAILHKYKTLVQECENNKSLDDSDGACQILCREFNVNKFSYLFDGEGRFIRSFMRKFSLVAQHLKNTDENFDYFFNKRRNSYVKNPLETV